MVVGEGSTDGLADLKAAVVGQKLDLGRRKGIVFGQLEHSVIEASLELFLQIVEAEMEVVQLSRHHHHRGDGLLLNGLRLFHNPGLGYSFIHLPYVIIQMLT